MKNFVVLFVLFIVTLMLFLASNLWKFDKEKYINNEILAISHPLGVK
jgi:hypothetical protein